MAEQKATPASTISPAQKSAASVDSDKKTFSDYFGEPTGASEHVRFDRSIAVMRDGQMILTDRPQDGDVPANTVRSYPDGTNYDTVKPPKQSN